MLDHLPIIVLGIISVAESVAIGCLLARKPSQVFVYDPRLDAFPAKPIAGVRVNRETHELQQARLDDHGKIEWQTIEKMVSC